MKPVIWTIYIWVTLHSTGEVRVVPMDFYFPTEDICERVVARYNENVVLWPEERDFDARYECVEFDENAG